MDPDDPQVACFEAGVKFGALYHQFAGTPVAPASTDSLATAIEESIENQPHCVAVSVDIHDSRVREAIDHDEGYTELTGALMDAAVTVEYEEVRVHTEMTMREGYPRMRVVSVDG